MELPQERVALLSSDEGGGSDSGTDSSEDEVTEHVRASPPRALPLGPPPHRTAHAPHAPVAAVAAMAAAHAVVPTISVTPHSPGVLDDSLQQLRRLHAAVQRMRAAPLHPHLTGSGRLSTSCPSLHKDGDTPETECCSPGHLYNYPASRKGSGESRQWGLWEGGDEGRRRSWAALEPARAERRQRGGALNGHSVSLSSMESEGDAAVAPPRHSTHSLNEAELAKDFEKVTAALRAGLCAGSPAALAAGAAQEALRLQPRLPLQKSVSTPSIVAAVQPPLPPGAPQPPGGSIRDTVDGDCRASLSAGGASDSESDDASAATVSGAGVNTPAARRNNMHLDHLGLQRLVYLEQVAFDAHSEKRRKRGSLFFRKKKDKARKASHAWQAACCGGDCDWCGRALADKPALYCDHCTMTVHQNNCKDYIVECNKPKSSKTSVGKSLSASSGKSSKRSSLSNQSVAANSKKQSTGCYSPWRLVATKLGVHTSHICNDEKDSSDHKHDHSNASDDQGGGEWPEAYLTADQLGAEAAALGLGATEADTWGGGAPKGLARSLGDREQKRQEHIYELVLTEKHHCLTIRLMQKMFAEGMIRTGNVSSAQVDRMFPRLDELWSLHASLLSRLRARQRAGAHVATVADILLDHFSSVTGDKFKSAYGEFCSRHRDAVEVFKECCAREPRLARFIRKCQTNPLLRKKGVPECVLFVAQRLTKYPLLLEPLLKTAGDDRLERERLQKALAGVKEILVDVDNQVAAKEREDRKLEIYHRIDAKSFANYRGRKFKKSDILQGNRSLKFEGMATLMQGRSKMQTLLVIVLTDVLFFLHDNNNKYTFFTPDNKTGVVSLVKLLVREKAGAEGRGLYLICSSPSEPEMFELRVHKPKDIAVWITSIRAAVQSCPEEEEESEAGATASTAEERQRQLEARHESIRLLTDDTPWWQLEEALRAKDREHASLLEDKMALHLRMAAASGGHTTPAAALEPGHIGVNTVFPGGLVVPDYVRLALPSADTHGLWQEVCNVVKEALDASAAAWGGAGGGLGRSTSSAGERHSVSYESPALPRRADTFGGFDNHHKVRKVVEGVTEAAVPTVAEGDATGGGGGGEPARPPADCPGGGEAALKLQHCVYTLSCIVWQQLTTVHSLEAQLYAWRCSGRADGAGRCHDTQLEELRDAQARLTAERSAWEAQRCADRDATADERRQLAAARAALAEQQRDVEQQRERLYRRLERLQRHHGGSQEELASVGTLSPDSSASEPVRRKEPKWRSNRGSTGSEPSAASVAALPPQLLSAQNESRATAAAQPHAPMVKQQLPLKLASGGGGGNVAGARQPPGYHRLQDTSAEMAPGAGVGGGAAPPAHHTRTGSSPAPLAHHAPPPTNKATRTNTYPKLPEKFRVRSPEVHAPPAAQPVARPVAQPVAQQEEEVIYF